MVMCFSVSTSVTGSFLRYVGIRNLSQEEEPADEEESLALALGLMMDELRTLDSIARTELDFLQGLKWVEGATMKDPRRCLGTTREQAARKALSIRRSFGAPTLRESTFTWCRSVLGRPDPIMRRSAA